MSMEPYETTKPVGRRPTVRSRPSRIILLPHGQHLARHAALPSAFRCSAPCVAPPAPGLFGGEMLDVATRKRAIRER